jgi:L-amino acid N-acyltransferase YncA
VRSTQAAYAPFGDEDFLSNLSVAERAERNIEWFAEGPESGRRYWVAELDGRVVGISYTGPSRDADATPGTGEVYTVYVHPE